MTSKIFDLEDIGSGAFGSVKKMIPLDKADTKPKVLKLYQNQNISDNKKQQKAYDSMLKECNAILDIFGTNNYLLSKEFKGCIFVDENNVGLVLNQLSPFNLQSLEQLDFYQVCFHLLEQLKVINDAKYYHGDLSLDNLLIQDNLLKIVDFGNAKNVNIKPSFAKAVNVAPEMTYQYIFEPPYDKIDVFACGLLFLQFLTKKEKIFEEIMGEELDRINVETFFINCIIDEEETLKKYNTDLKKILFNDNINFDDNIDSDNNMNFDNNIDNKFNSKIQKSEDLQMDEIDFYFRYLVYFMLRILPKNRPTIEACIDFLSSKMNMSFDTSTRMKTSTKTSNENTSFCSNKIRAELNNNRLEIFDDLVSNIHKKNSIHNFKGILALPAKPSFLIKRMKRKNPLSKKPTYQSKKLRLIQNNNIHKKSSFGGKRKLKKNKSKLKKKIKKRKKYKKISQKK